MILTSQQSPIVTSTLVDVPGSFTPVTDFLTPLNLNLQPVSTDYSSISGSYLNLVYGDTFNTQSTGSDFSYLDFELRNSHKKPLNASIDELFEALNPSIESNSSSKDLLNLATQVDDIEKFEALENIRSNYISTSPNVKLYYPEPFIASPSFMHNDIGFLHILQYQFWLWFLFIFLIVFYFISFLSIVRWCSNRTQPRRETRGVSRSKCGDLITATVPVTWAVSIIVSESTDATDYYDGFGTGELIVGVRAYQWGWHYYYPKHADLNYNVKPSYSTFVGNSLKYNTTTSKKLNTNSLWKFYQSKVDDAVISPAHIFVIPTDNSKILNMMSFKNIGIDNLQASKAFKQVRANSRVYVTNLNHNPSALTHSYLKLNSLFANESTLMNSNSFGLKRPNTLTSAAATTAINSTFLDNKSMNKFLNYNLQFNSASSKTNLFNKSNDLWSKSNDSQLTPNSVNLYKTLTEGTKKYNSATLKLLLLYPNLIKEMGDDSDKKAVNFPFRKLLKKTFTKNVSTNLKSSESLLNLNQSSDQSGSTSRYIDTSIDNLPRTSKEFMIQYSYQSQPFSKQSVRRYKNLSAYTTNYNLSNGLNTVDSNTKRSSQNNNFITPFYKYNLKKTNWSDLTLFNKLSSNRVMYSGIAPILSNNPYLGRLSYDRTFAVTNKSYYNPKSIVNKWGAAEEGTSSTTTLKPYTGVAKGLNNNDSTNVEYQDWRKKRTSTVQLFAGDRTGEDKSSTSSYWQMYWAGTNPDW
jgi:hypothetical protein